MILKLGMLFLLSCASPLRHPVENSSTLLAQKLSEQCSDAEGKGRLTYREQKYLFDFEYASSPGKFDLVASIPLGESEVLEWREGREIQGSFAQRLRQAFGLFQEESSVSTEIYPQLSQSMAQVFSFLGNPSQALSQCVQGNDQILECVHRGGPSLNWKVEEKGLFGTRELEDGFLLEIFLKTGPDDEAKKFELALSKKVFDNYKRQLALELFLHDCRNTSKE